MAKLYYRNGTVRFASLGVYNEAYKRIECPSLARACHVVNQRQLYGVARFRGLKMVQRFHRHYSDIAVTLQ